MAIEERPESEVRSAEGGAEPARRWLDEHGDALYRYAKGRVGRAEDAEDLVQETLLAAFRARDGYQGRSSERTWLLSILRHKVVDFLRRGYDRAHRSLDDEADADPVRVRFFTESGTWKGGVVSWGHPAADLISREFQEALAGCVGRLPRRLAVPFILRELEGMDMDEIRGTLALSPENLRVRLYRARVLLRECLETRWFGGAKPGSGGAP